MKKTLRPANFSEVFRSGRSPRGYWRRHQRAARRRRTGSHRWETLLAFAVVLVGTAVGAWAVLTYRNHLRNPRADAIPQRFAYDLQSFQDVPPERVGFEPAWTVNLPASELRALTVDAQTAWVAADEVLLGVSLSHQGGEVSEEIALPVPPRSVAVGVWQNKDGGTQDRFFVGSGSRVMVFDRQGQLLQEWGFFGEKAIITDLAVAGDEVFVADAGNRLVHRIDRFGEKIGEIGQRDAERGILGFVIPSPYFSLAWGADGLLRVANPGARRIEIYTLQGDLEFFWGEPGLSEAAFCGCCNPANIAVTKDGELVTAEKGIPRVKLYSGQGELLTWIAPPSHFIDLAKLSETREESRAPVLDVAVFTVPETGGSGAAKASPEKTSDSAAETLTAQDATGSGQTWVLVLDPARKVLEAFRPKSRGLHPPDEVGTGKNS